MYGLDASKQGIQQGLITFRNALWVSASAYALALTYLSDDFAPLTWVALIPFFVVIRGSSRPAAVGFGALLGTVYFLLFGLVGAGLPLRSFPASLFIGIISSALLALSLSIVLRRLGFNPIALGLAWLTFEVIRIELVLRFEMTASQRRDGPTLSVAGIVGLLTLSFLIALVNILLIRLLNWAFKNLRNRPGEREAVPTLHHRRSACIHVHPGCCFRPEERGPPYRPLPRFTLPVGLFLPSVLAIEELRE